MSYDEQAARRVVAERALWAVEEARRALIDHNAKAKHVAILASEMLRQLPMVVPETPNDDTHREP